MASLEGSNAPASLLSLKRCPRSFVSLEGEMPVSLGGKKKALSLWSHWKEQKRTYAGGFTGRKNTPVSVVSLERKMALV